MSTAQYIGIASKVHEFEKRPTGRFGIIGHDDDGNEIKGPLVLDICVRCGFDCSWPNQETTIECIPREKPVDAELDQQTEDRITEGGSGEVEF